MSKYSFRAHAASDRRKWVAVTIAILFIVAIIVTGVLTDWFINWNKYCLFGHAYGENGICTRCGKEKLDEVEGANDEYEEAAVNGGGLATVLPGNGISLMATKMDRIAGVPTAVVENTWELTATVNEDADYKTVDWTVEFTDPASEWATGKTVTDYVTVTPSEDGALTSTVKVLQDFGEQIKVTCTARDTTLGVKKAECLFDYVQKITGFTFTMSDLINGENTFNYEVESTQYTVSAEIQLSFSSMTLNSSFADLAKTYAKEMVKGKDFSCESLIDDYFNFNSATLKVHDNVISFDSTRFEESYFENDYHLMENFGYSVLDYFLENPNDENQVNVFTSFNHDFRSVTLLKKMIDNFSGNYHASFDLTYSAVYGGKTYSSGQQTVQVNFDRKSLFVPVRDITLDQSHIYA